MPRLYGDVFETYFVLGGNFDSKLFDVSGQIICEFSRLPFVVSIDPTPAAAEIKDNIRVKSASFTRAISSLASISNNKRLKVEK